MRLTAQDRSAEGAFFVSGWLPGAHYSADVVSLSAGTAENLGSRLGWQEADTAEFAETLRAVGDATSGDMTN